MMKALLRFGPTRSVLNFLYNRLSIEGREKIHNRYSKIFGENDGPDAIWTVEFLGKKIRMPMRNWNQALTIAAYDSAVVRMYERLLSHRQFRPTVFVDIGANFGTHSYLFAAHGITSIVFEPNPRCHPYIVATEAANNFPDITRYRIAIGNEFAQTKIWFPSEATWLGIIGNTREEAMEHKRASDPECPKLNNGTPMSSEPVMIQKLDAYYGLIARATQDGTHALIKIDVEGYEYEVMCGAAYVIKEQRPLIMFECFNSTETREKIWQFLQTHGYVIVPVSQRHYLNHEFSSSHGGFLYDEGYNFLALPKELYQ